MIVVDSNVLVRLVSFGSPQRPVAQRALWKLRNDGEILCVATQVVAETWAVITRPSNQRGGLGFVYSNALRYRRRIEQVFEHLPDPDDLYSRWTGLIDSLRIVGVNSHEARLVAVMNANGVDSILTFNGRDFNRYPGVKVIDPASVA